MATNIIPNKDARQLEQDNFAYQGDGSDNTKVVRRVEDEEALSLLQQILTALGGGSASVWTRSSTLIVDAGQTLVVDVTLLSAFSRIDYIINYKDNPVTVTRSQKLTVQNNAGTITETVSERLGGSIDAPINVTDDSVDCFIEITNNELFDIEVTFLKAITT